jgi:hypothetical protein
LGVYLINTLEDIKLREEKQQLTLALPQINGLSQVWWVKCILRYITPNGGVNNNHGFLDNPTFRGTKQQLINTFDEIFIYDLHGNSKKKEICPDGSKDENVFDIQQGVSIGIMVKSLMTP